MRYYLNVFLALTLFSAATVASADTLEFALDFGEPRFQSESKGYSSISIEGLSNTIEAGMPSLPLKTMKVALPSGGKFEGIRLSVEITKEYIAKPTKSGSHLPFSFREGVPKGLDSAPSPSFKGAKYPQRRISYKEQMYHGVPVVVVNVYPVVMNTNGTVDHMVTGKLEVLYSIEDSAVSMFKHQIEDVRSFVDNDEVLDSYKESTLRGDEYDYLIISNSTFINYSGPFGFQAFRDNLSSRGLKSKLVNIDTVSAGQGIDLAQKVRNFLRSEYDQFGIKYVLLAADGDSSGSTIPPRRLWSRLRGYTGSWQWIEKNVASDFYYSCLDGPFNGNGNDKWGEPTDGEGGQDVDLLPEVIVGRMSMDTTEDFQNMIRKTLWVSSNISDKKTYLMGEELFKEMDLYGGDYMNQLVGECTDHAYTTNGYTSDWDVSTLYDRDSKWSGSTALSRISSNSFSMINHLGHSNTSYNMRLSTYWGFPKFTNDKPFFYYTQGCYPGDYTVNDCFIEKMVRHEKAAVASIANTAYGLGPEDPDPDSTATPGASQILHRTFINAIFNEGFTNLGAAHQRSKVFHIGYSSTQEMRWVYWVATYFGDPSLEFQY